MTMTSEQAKNLGAFALKMQGLGIGAKFSRLETGPVVTSYHFKLDHDVPISRMIKKSEDFALAAEVEKVTIQRISGEVVIFVPNKERQFVDFSSCLQWICTDPKAREMNLPICLGVDPIGNKIAIDLTEQPHILIAGETGSGKSVLEASILATLAIARDSNFVKFVLVDTKLLDLPLFKNLSHVEKVITTVQEFHNYFNMLLHMVRTRMQKLQGASCRNIAEYHGLGYEMPYYLIMIDELADIIDQDLSIRKADEDALAGVPTIKQWIKQLAQISRAAGVHIIACTQRSSVKIVDGDIKVNLPCRIALRLPTGFDSRTILGTEGAETLLGKGDMLVQMPNSEVIKRFHGPFVDLSHIAYVVAEEHQVREMFEKMSK